jgi:hypothetical protein
MTMPNHLATPYRRSRYHVAGITLAIGRKSGALDGVLSGLGVRQAVLITAWNPASRRMPPGWNERMMAELRSRLGGAPWLPAQSGSGPWAEQQLLATGDRRRLRVLARRFRQAAMVGLQRGGALRLLPLV